MDVGDETNLKKTKIYRAISQNYLKDEKLKEALALTHSTLSLVLIVLGMMAGIGARFAHPISAILVPDFSPEKQALTAELLGSSR